MAMKHRVPVRLAHTAVTALPRRKSQARVCHTQRSIQNLLVRDRAPDPVTVRIIHVINNPCSSRPGTAVARVRQVVDAHEAHCVVILRGLGAPPCPCCLDLPRRAVVLQPLLQLAAARYNMLDSLQLAECPWHDLFLCE